MSPGKNLIKADTRVNLLGNKIVLIAPKDSKTTTLEVKQGVDLAKALAGGKLAMANVDAVPAGKYGKAALEKLGAWNGVKDKRRAGRERARRAPAGGARRGAARHRLCDRRRGRAQRQDRRRPSPRIPIRRSSIRRR